jgi:large subunit ribosomal protein L10
LALTKERKAELYDQYKKLFADAQIAVVAGYQGLTVHDLEALRARMREVGGELHVVKNTLARIALEDLGVKSPEELWEQANALGVTTGDAVVLAKTLSDFARTDERFSIKAGFLGKNYVTADGVKRLASLPSREVLLAQVFAGMQAPITGIVTVLGGVLRGLMNVLNARAEQLEKASA